MNKFLIYNKKNIIKQFVLSISFSLVIFVFMLYFSPIRYYKLSLDKFNKSNLMDSYYVINEKHTEFNKEFFLNLINNKTIKNAYIQAYPDWTIDENTGLNSLPQFYEYKDYNAFPLNTKENIDISNLRQLPDNNYYLILSSLSNINVGESVTLKDSNGEDIILHAIARQKNNIISLDMSETSKNILWTDILKKNIYQDYILVSNMYNDSNDWNTSSNFIIETNDSKNNDLSNEFQNNDLVLYNTEKISLNTFRSIDRSTYLNISFLIISFLIFTLLYTNLTFLDSFRFSKRYIIYRKLGTTKKGLIFYKLIFNVTFLLFGLLLSWLYIYILNIIKPEAIFMRDNLMFDKILYIWTIVIFIIYVVLGSIIQIISLNNIFSKKGIEA